MTRNGVGNYHNFIIFNMNSAESNDDGSKFSLDFEFEGFASYHFALRLELDF